MSDSNRSILGATLRFADRNDNYPFQHGPPVFLPRLGDRVSSEQDEKPTSDVTATYLLPFFEGVTKLQARATKNALNQMTRKPNEIIAAATIRLSDTFRVSVVDRNRPMPARRCSSGGMSRRNEA